MQVEIEQLRTALATVLAARKPKFKRARRGYRPLPPVELPFSPNYGLIGASRQHRRYVERERAKGVPARKPSTLKTQPPKTFFYAPRPN